MRAFQERHMKRMNMRLAEVLFLPPVSLFHEDGWGAAAG